MHGDEDTDPTELAGEKLTANADALKKAWKNTLDEMDALADEYEAEGWETTTVPVGHTAPESPQGGDTDRWGFVFTVPDNFADEVQETVAEREFPEYDVYRNQVAERVFLVVVYLDPASEHALLVAGNYQVAYARTLMEKATTEGEVYSYLRTLDDTQLAVFKHDDPEKFMPRE
jgi:cation transport regulator ChaC